MRLYMMTDIEGVAGVLNFDDWVAPGQRYYEVAKELLTLEVNAAIGGFIAGGVEEILVADGHGAGGIDVRLLDHRVDLLRGWPEGPYPLGLDQSFDAIAWVGQHAKAGTEYAHLAHTQSPCVLDLTVNGISVGEFGQLVMCASELGVGAVFATGDLAFTQEAQALVPGIETVAVKWGVKAGTGNSLTEEEYARFTASARHVHPVRARELIHQGALRAAQRMRAARRDDRAGLVPLTPPFERVIKLRPTQDRPYRTISRATHPTSVIAMMNMEGEEERLEE